MEGMMDSSAVTLVVKTPNRSMEDLQISCALNWTVEKIKRHLSSVYPSKPESKKQRLIYSGQLLLDHQTVRDFLREHEDGQLHTVHLVCPPSINESSPSNSSSSLSKSSSSTPTSTPSTPTQTTAQPTNGGLRYRGQNMPPFPMPSPQMWPINAQTPFQPAMTPPNLQQQMNQHQLWMHHMQQVYQHQMAAAARQPQANFMYMPPNMQMPHMPFWPYQTPGVMPQVLPPVYTPPPSPQQPIPPQQVPPQTPLQPEVLQQQQAQPRNQEVQMNAQGGLADEDDDEDNMNNDWLDKIYTLCRVAILLSIVWFYSSTGRFLVLILSLLMIYMYQWGVFRWLFQNQQQQQQPEVNIPQAQVQEEGQNHEETDNTEAGDSNEEEDATITQDSDTHETETAEATQPPPPPAGPSAFRIAISFVSTFFTSLIPQHNEVFQGN